jgi:hypothetical protein
MTAIHETAYPRIKPNLSQKELNELFTPTVEELDLLNEKTRQTFPVSRLGFMLLLKYYQYLGRPVKTLKIEPTIKKHVAIQIGVGTDLDLSNYNKSVKYRHAQAIREYLKINMDQKERRKIMKAAALNAAATKENLADIINVVIEELVKFSFEFPSFRKLERLSRAARVVINNNNYLEICNKLTDSQRKLIDCILGDKEADDNHEYPSWAELKQEPKKPTVKKIKAFTDHVNKLKSIWQQININLNFIPHVRLEQLRDEAIVADLDDMQRMRSIKKYALATILIYMKTSTALDDLVETFILWIRQIETQAKNNLEIYRLAQATKTDAFVVFFYNTLLALKNNSSADDKVGAIEEVLGGKTDELIEQCREYLGLTGENHITWMKRPYKNKRYVIFQILDNLAIFSSTNDKSIENALKFIMHYSSSSDEWVDLDKTPNIQPDLSLLSDGWYKAVTGNEEPPIKKINRLYYEIAVLVVLKNDLNCSDAYVAGAFIYDDPNKQFITWEEFALEVDGYCDLVKLPKEPGKFVALLQTKLQQTAKKVDENYPNNHFLIIDKGLPILKKSPKKQEPKDLEKIRQMVMDQMPVVSIVDIIIDVENWLNLSIHFKPLSGYERKIKDYSSRFVATALSYGSM